jgi:transposase
MRIVDLEELIGQEHKARAIWDLSGKLNLAEFEKQTQSIEGEVGRSAWSPRLLVSLWLYGYSEGITSARELARLMEFEPGLQWLTGLKRINHHTLSDFRVRRKGELDELFTQLLLVLQEANLISLERVMHDSTKIRARAGGDTFRQEKTLQEKLEQARRLVQEDPQGEGSRRREQAQKRAQRERRSALRKPLRSWKKFGRTSPGKQKSARRASV